MNTSNIKRYAPKARTAFIAAMTKRAALFGIRESSIPSTGIEPLEQKGDLALIGDLPFPASIIRPRAALVKKVEQMGFAQAMEQAAYSWFNRLCAIRYMELKGYLDHGRRVLSHPEQPGSFQILDDCMDIELEGLDKQRIAELKLDGTKDEALYRELLLVQCHALHQAMPFLFESIDDATELLLPDNLTKTDSLIRELVSAIPEEDWQDVEIIGWLYQFYISEKKDQVIGKVVKSEDIPAATQLFTPNWIVQYLVQNSVGCQWLQTYPDSPLKAKMPYYIEPAEQAPEVQAHLAAITPDSIDPLTIKVLDPACGSGHILVEAYKVLKAIYEERGFRSRDIPRLILENNLFGLDIDDRAGQLAGFALMMLAREDDRRIFSREIKLNVLSLQESNHLDINSLWRGLNFTNNWQDGQSQNLFDSQQIDLSVASADNRFQLLKATLARFTLAKTFGSLIEVPTESAKSLEELLSQLRQMASEGDLMQRPFAELLVPYVQQAWILAQKYDAIVANPPYMGSAGMNSTLKEFSKVHYSGSKSDLFAIFIERGFHALKQGGFNAMVTMQSWMFLSGFEELRQNILQKKTICTLTHIGYNSFPELNSKIVQCVAFSIRNIKIDGSKGIYVDLNSSPQSANKRDVFGTRTSAIMYAATQEGFGKIPGSPLAYWKDYSALYSCGKISQKFSSGGRCKTHDDDRFVRYVWEVDSSKLGVKWKLYEKGGDYRPWYGNKNFVVDWSLPSRKHYASFGGLTQEKYWGRPGVTWSAITTAKNSFRFKTPDAEYSSGSPTIFSEHDNHDELYLLLGALNSGLYVDLLKVICPTINANPGDILKLPMAKGLQGGYVEELVSIYKEDWELKENHVGFSIVPTINGKDQNSKIKLALEDYVNKSDEATKRALVLTNLINEDVGSVSAIDSKKDNITDIALFQNRRYKKTEQDFMAEFESTTISELISYSVGCIMGRFSLDRNGLVYAHAGNIGFTDLRNEGAYKTYPADRDGILPLTDQEWFADDATNRVRAFVRAVWGEENLQENLDFVAGRLCLYAIKSKRGESSLDTIRRYLSTQFYKDHLKTYKKRPIYWLFSSGKHKAFECLVYLHRYNEGTLARMRTEYVIPLTAKLNTYANKLATDIENETVTSEKRRLEKELATLHNQQAELATFDEKLRHCADQRINLDLDEGVKVNYGRFGDLLYEAKLIAGEQSEKRS